MIPQYEPLILKSYANDVKNQILSGWIGSGEATLKFEEKICSITKAKYCISTTSGTTAILIGLNCIDKTTVAFPSYTFLAGANAAKFLGFDVKLVDIKRETLSMNPDLCKNFDAVIFVNHNGYCDKDILEIKNNNKFVIEDSSQALGIENAGRIGDIGIFSFSVPKIITTGQGGAIITDNEEIYKKCKEIRDHGDNWRKTRLHENLGVNFKFNDILASYGLAQLNILDDLLELREKVFNRYRKYIQIKDFGYSSTWMVIYETNKADLIIEKLKENNIEAVKYYKPINHNKLYKGGFYPEAEYVYENCIYLPSSLTLKMKDIDRICKVILIS